MTAKDYLKSQVSDECAESASVQTRKGLAAYALRMQAGVEGYSLDDAEKIMRSCGYGDDFVNKCIRYISEANDFAQMVSLLPCWIED